jgi:Ceramidase
MLSMASWFGDLNRPIDIYCERTSAACDAEPLNAISNFAFFIAAWAVWPLQRERPNVTLHGPVRALWIVIAIVGAGSLTFHTVATRWAEWAGAVPILVFMIVYCWLILTAFFRWPLWMKFVSTLVFFAATFFLESDAFETFLWGGTMYLPTLVFPVAAGVGIWRFDAGAGRAFFAAAGLFALSFAARTLDQPLCGTIPIGTHYIWHFFNAGVLFLLVRPAILHATGGDEAAAAKISAAGASRGLPGSPSRVNKSA